METAGSNSTYAPEITVRLVRGERQGTKNDPMDVSLMGTVEGGGEGLGLGRGSVVEIRMSEYPLDCNRLLPDLLNGSTEFGVPECGPGSVVRFASCTGEPGSRVVQVSSYEVVEALAPEAAAEPAGPAAAASLGAAEGGPAHRLSPEPFGAEHGGPAHRLW